MCTIECWLDLWLKLHRIESVPLSIMATCHGHEFAVAFVPPTILLGVIAGTPHIPAENGKILHVVIIQGCHILKGPWILVRILEDPRKFLESLKSLNSALSVIHHIGAVMRHFLNIFKSLTITKRSLKRPWIILEFCRSNFVATL